MSDKSAAKKGGARIAENRKARHDFSIEKKIEAGIVLKGSEVKSCREGKVQLVDAFASFENGELFLLKSHIAEFKQGGPFYNHPPVRKRKLLLHKKELAILAASIEQQGYTLVPLRIYFKRGLAKVELGLAKGKKSHDKRQSIRDKEEKRSMDKALKGR